MRSFGIFSAVAAVACSIFASAAPVEFIGVGAGAKAGVAAIYRREPAAALDVADVEARSAQITPLYTILSTLKTEIQPGCAQLGGMSPGDATPENIIPILTGIAASFQTAYGSCQPLQGQGSDVILASVDGVVVTVAVIVGLLVEIIFLVVEALYFILGLVSVTLLGPIFGEVGGLLFSLTSCCCGLVPGLLAAVVPLVASLSSQMGSCGFTGLSGYFGFL